MSFECAGSKLYVFGGLTAVGPSSVVEPLSDCWVLDTQLDASSA
jgi:N-acetylneuraminic acid mutarotase